MSNSSALSNRSPNRRLRAVLALLGLIGLSACVSSGLPGGESRLVAGLKEALRVGIENAVARTSRSDGYLRNESIRIRLPSLVDKMAQGMRLIGMGAKVDELEVSMNRAAEQAAGEAAEVFWEGIQQMTFEDARAILNGGDTAATEFFERTTRAPLRRRFQPIVNAKMDRVGLVQQYDALVGRYRSIPFAQAPQLDIREFVTDRALDGLFHVLGEEEKRIRTDPAARVTALLREVFGS